MKINIPVIERRRFPIPIIFVRIAQLMEARNVLVSIEESRRETERKILFMSRVKEALEYLMPITGRW